jgi:DNA polymerase III delta prime subunit
MAELIINPQPSSSTEEKTVTNTIEETSPIESSSNLNGMTQEEIKDPNKIKVEIANYQIPIVVLFGPPSCGKTMTLIRLTRYLRSMGYTVQPVTSFRPSYDKNYGDMCKNFDNMINSDDAAASTSRINFMLVEVLQNGRPICQILEAPGEHYFDPNNISAEFPTYVYEIIRSSNRKIWTIVVEPDNTGHLDSEKRRNYVTRIHSLKQKINLKDDIVFCFNKVDQTPFVISPGNVRIGELVKHTNYLYSNIFVPFMNQNPITKLWRPYNFDFFAFQTGYFVEASDGTLRFTEGNDVYPNKFWAIILNKIRG